MMIKSMHHLFRLLNKINMTYKHTLIKTPKLNIFLVSTTETVRLHSSKRKSVLNLHEVMNDKIVLLIRFIGTFAII